MDYAFIEDFCAELGLDASQCEEAPIDAVYERLRSGEYDLVIAPEYGDMEGVDATKYASDAIIYRKVQTPLDRRRIQTTRWASFLSSSPPVPTPACSR